MIYTYSIHKPLNIYEKNALISYYLQPVHNALIVFIISDIKSIIKILWKNFEMSRQCCFNSTCLTLFLITRLSLFILNEVTWPNWKCLEYKIHSLKYLAFIIDWSIYVETYLLPIKTISLLNTAVYNIDN